MMNTFVQLRRGAGSIVAGRRTPEYGQGDAGSNRTLGADSDTGITDVEDVAVG